MGVVSHIVWETELVKPNAGRGLGAEYGGMFCLAGCSLGMHAKT